MTDPRTEAPTQVRDLVTWEALDRLVADLADRLAGEPFDVMLAITRGGLVPAGMLAYRLRIRNILVATTMACRRGTPSCPSFARRWLGTPWIRSA